MHQCLILMHTILSISIFQTSFLSTLWCILYCVYDHVWKRGMSSFWKSTNVILPCLLRSKMATSSSISSTMLWAPPFLWSIIILSRSKTVRQPFLSWSSTSKISLSVHFWVPLVRASLCLRYSCACSRFKCARRSLFKPSCVSRLIREMPGARPRSRPESTRSLGTTSLLNSR